MFVPLAASQVVGVGFPSATPEALAPRNDGQFCARAIDAIPAINTRQIATLTTVATLSILFLEFIDPPVSIAQTLVAFQMLPRASSVHQVKQTRGTLNR